MKKIIAFIITAGIMVSAGIFFIAEQNGWFESVVEDTAEKTHINIK